MHATGTIDLLGVCALGLAGVAAFSGARLLRGTSDARRAAVPILLGASSLALLSVAMLMLAQSAGEARHDAEARGELAASHRDALERRLDGFATGLRDELHSRNRHRISLDAQVDALQRDVAQTRSMLVDLAHTYGALVTREGRLGEGPHARTFRPCGASESWALRLGSQGDARERIAAVLAADGGRLVALTGVLSRRGRFGDAGDSPHLFVVIDAGPAARADCG